MPLCLTHAGAVIPDQAGLRAMRQSFERDCHLRLPGFFSPGLLPMVLRHVAAAPFRIRSHGKVDARDWMLDTTHPLHGLLHFLAHDPALLRAMEAITGEPVLGSFTGYVYRMTSGGETYDDWHDDIKGARRVAISANLSDGSYQGGSLTLRRKQSQEVLAVVDNRTVGDAVLFKIGPGLEHRVGETVGPVARTAFAGWFKSEPVFTSYVKERLFASG